MTRHFKVAVLAAVALAGGADLARADIITALAAAPVAVTGGYAYTYNVELAGQSQLIGTNTAGSSGTAASTSEFGTLNDFGPIVTDSSGAYEITTTGLLSTDFAFSFNLVDTPPAFTAPTDDPTLRNVRYTYDLPNTLIYVNGMGYKAPMGTTTTYTGLDESATDLGSFTVVSPYGPPLNTSLFYDGQTYKSTNDTQQQNLGLVSGPSVPVPEPTTAGLIGVGVAGLGLARRRRRTVIAG